MDRTRIDVRTDSGNYPIAIEPGLLGGLRRLLAEEHFPGRAFIVSSPTVWRLHGVAIVHPHP